MYVQRSGSGCFRGVGRRYLVYVTRVYVIRAASFERADIYACLIILRNAAATSTRKARTRSLLTIYSLRLSIRAIN